MQKIRGLDILRGVAIILVMLLHSSTFLITTRMGWIGVDLFFVLSGFLVSGLLFTEFKATGSIKSFRFFLRRGFKIYPLFYFVLLCHVIYYLVKQDNLPINKLLPELFFYQNYKEGIMGVSWSLAVEEHFYLFLLFVIWLMIKMGWMTNGKLMQSFFILICLFCLVLRLYVFQQNGYGGLFVNDFPTHLRMDSLVFGVLISYWYYFYKRQFVFVVRKLSWLLSFVALGLLIPFFLIERQSWLISTIGYSFLYVAFGIVLSIVICHQNTNIGKWVNFFLVKNFGDLLGWVGRQSYAIYLCHFLVGLAMLNLFKKTFPMAGSVYILLPVYLTVNILTGAFLTWVIEKPALRVREKYFPAIF